MASGGFVEGDVGGFEDDGTFFPVLPVFPDDTDEEPRRTLYIGGDVGPDVLLVRNERAAVVVRSLWAQPDGFSFQLMQHTREQQNVHGPFSPWGRDPNEHLRVGLVYPDGTKVLAEHAWQPDSAARTHGLQPGGGSADGWRYETTYRAWPLPTEGTLTFVVRWRAMGIDDVRYDLDASLLIDAARRAEPLWG